VIQTGMGFDAHAFDDSRTLVLGGVTFPESPGLAGHSDADVLSHAIADALLGAAGLGDLGSCFPPTDRWKDASSLEILEQTAGMLADEGWAVVNVDATVIAETPRVSPARAEIVANLARALNVDPAVVSVKSTTTDGMGFVGRKEGIGALAVVLVERH
jgi:2-C-methyl-D-erythritol 2,4-cyclodiphosphate synthase